MTPQSNNTPAPEKPQRPNLAVTAIKWILCLLVIAFVARELVRQFGRIQWASLRFDPLMATLALVSLAGVSLVHLAAYRLLAAAYSHRLQWRVAMAAAWIAPLGKYLPGKVAAIAAAIYILKKRGMSGVVAFGVALIQDGLAVITGLIVATPILFWEPVRKVWPGAWIWSISIVVVGLVCLHPKVFMACANLVLRKLGRQPFDKPLPWHSYLLPLVCMASQWLFAGVGLWLMARSVESVAPSKLPLMISTAALAMTISYLAIFAPGGLGVREALYLAVLTPLVGPAAAVITLGMRLAQTLVEIAMAAIAVPAVRSVDGQNLQSEA